MVFKPMEVDFLVHIIGRGGVLRGKKDRDDCQKS